MIGPILRIRQPKGNLSVCISALPSFLSLAGVVLYCAIAGQSGTVCYQMCLGTPVITCICYGGTNSCAGTVVIDTPQWKPIFSKDERDRGICANSVGRGESLCKEIEGNIKRCAGARRCVMEVELVALKKLSRISITSS